MHFCKRAYYKHRVSLLVERGKALLAGLGGEWEKL